MHDSDDKEAASPVGYIGARRRRRRRSVLLIALAIVLPQLLLVGLLASGLGVIPNENTSTANAGAHKLPSTLQSGDCVRKSLSVSPTRAASEESEEKTQGSLALPTVSTTPIPTATPSPRNPDFANATIPARYAPAFTRVPCGANHVYGKAIEVINEAGTGTEACDERTDFFAQQDTQLVCLRQVRGEHPGDPGNGGGVFRAGDCAESKPAGHIYEVPCPSSHVFEIVTARVKTVAECQAPAHRFATLDSGTARVLCLREGPAMAGNGQCMADPDHAPASFAAVNCASPPAHAQVLGRAASPQQCASIPGQTHYVEDPDGLPATRLVCLKMLKNAAFHQ